MHFMSLWLPTRSSQTPESSSADLITQENVDILNTELSVETSKNAPDVEQRILLREDKRCSQNKRTVSMKVDPSL